MSYDDDGDRMLQVKVFDEEHEDDLSEAINQFLLEHETLKLYDIKFSTAFGLLEDEQIYCFSALLIYQL